MHLSIEARKSETWRMASSESRNTCSFEDIISLGLWVYTGRCSVCYGYWMLAEQCQRGGWLDGKWQGKMLV